LIINNIKKNKKQKKEKKENFEFNLAKIFANF